MQLEFYAKASIINDAVALFILGGMIIYTTLYRRRGKTEDKVFFALIITDIILAAIDVLLHIIYGFKIVNTVIGVVYATVTFASLDVFMLLLSMYLLLRIGLDNARVRKYLPFMCIPIFFHIILVIVSIYLTFGYEGELNMIVLTLTTYNFLAYAPIMVYGLITLALTFKKNKRVLVLFIVLIVPLAFLVLTSISTIVPLGLAVYLVYAHLYTLRDDFYEEVSRCGN